MAGAPESDASRIARLREMVARYEIKMSAVGHLRKLEDFEVVLLCDDSGSMNSESVPRPPAAAATRWTELKEAASIVVDLAGALDEDGIDVYFLNRPPMLKVKTAAAVRANFEEDADGSTPLCRVFNQIMAAKSAILGEKRLLILIATDGEPDEGIPAFVSLLKSHHKMVHIGILACTDDDDAIGYLQGVDEGDDQIDVVDDYLTERAGILKKKGKACADLYTHGDHIVKVLLGAVNPMYDGLDE